MKITNLGFPNAHGLKIKKALEAFWAGKASAAEVQATFEQVQAFNAEVQANLDLRPVFDIDLYDRFLRTCVLFGLLANRFGSAEAAAADLNAYTSIPRGNSDALAAPMVKWFNTNYHVVQPQVDSDPCLTKDFPLPKMDAKCKLALIGPQTLLAYAVNKTENSDAALFAKLCDCYVEFINGLPAGAVVQLEEPAFITHGLPEAYADFVKRLNPRIHLHVYFSHVRDFADKLFALEVEGIGLDFVDGAENLELLKRFPKDKTLIAGILSGRNVWRASSRVRDVLAKICGAIDENKLIISPSCPLMHVPLSAEGEAEDFAFACEKIKELEAIKEGRLAYREFNSDCDAELPAKDFRRARKDYWVSEMDYPTSTIGSFPQTPELRRSRKAWKKGELSPEDYEQAMRDYIKDCIERQDAIGLDVLVHGEPERNDMVQYFAEHFEGFVPIEGWVQSYGTRYTRPPVIKSDIRRNSPFTVPWIEYAQSCTDKPVKGMLTGPVTIAQWSYRREDISAEAQYYQIAEALAGEVKDLAAAGIHHIQIDEPAIREGLPLDAQKRPHYLKHAVNAFRRVFSEAPDSTVIYSHICFSEFNDIMQSICDMGVDVLSIEDSKSGGKVARQISQAGFPGSLALGVYDVHSPRIPSLEEMLKIPQGLKMDTKRIWIKPDCGLKTRGPEAYEQLEQMVKAAKLLREQAAKAAG